MLKNSSSFSQVILGAFTDYVDIDFSTMDDYDPLIWSLFVQPSSVLRVVEPEDC